MHVRPGTPNDLPDIFKMGYDAWHEGRSEEKYIADCTACPKYPKGVWYVLEDSDGKLLSSLICYKNAFGLAEHCVGIGSVATMLGARKKGYALHLLTHILEKLKQEQLRRVYLYSDINPVYYARLGFKALDDRLQKHLPSVCMVLNITKQETENAAPSYF